MTLRLSVELSYSCFSYWNSWRRTGNTVLTGAISSPWQAETSTTLFGREKEEASSSGGELRKLMGYKPGSFRTSVCPMHSVHRVTIWSILGDRKKIPNQPTHLQHTVTHLSISNSSRKGDPLCLDIWAHQSCILYNGIFSEEVRNDFSYCRQTRKSNRLAAWNF